MLSFHLVAWDSRGREILVTLQPDWPSAGLGHRRYYLNPGWVRERHDLKRFGLEDSNR
jgi:hypothetical protein